MANESPWARTKIRDGQYLDILKIRPVPEDSDDVIYEIQSQYHQRPDLLAYDMYGSKVVYAPRNMDTLKDSFMISKQVYHIRSKVVIN